jgi:hypothetical protein
MTFQDALPQECLADRRSPIFPVGELINGDDFQKAPAL